MRARVFAVFTLAVLAGCGGGEAKPTTGSVTGAVMLGDMPASSSGIVVGLLGRASALTDDSGQYTIDNVPPGTYTLQAQKAGYQPASESVTITAGQTLTADPLVLQPIAPTPGTVTGKVLLFDALTHGGSTVTLSGAGGMATTMSTGDFSIANVPPGTYTATIAHATYLPQTVGNVVVTAGGTFTLPDVTLRRSSAVANTGNLSFIGGSADGSLAMYFWDGAVQVVSLATGAATIVSRGTSAYSGAITPDNKHVVLIGSWPNGNASLWVGPIDGSSAPVFVSGNVTNWGAGSDGANIWYSTFNPDYSLNFYAASTTTGASTLLHASAQVYADNFATGQLIIYYSEQTVAGVDVRDLLFYDPRGAGTTTVIPGVAIGQVDILAESGAWISLFVDIGASTAPPARGNLWLWRGADAAPTKLTGTVADVSSSAISFQPRFAAGHVYVSSRNDDADNTWATLAVDLGATPALRTLVAHSSGPLLQPTGFALTPWGESSGAMGYAQHTKLLALDQTHTANVYSDALVSIDMATAQATVVAPTLSMPGGSPATIPANAPLSQLVSRLDDTHFAYTINRTNTLMQLGLWDGAYAHVVTPSSVGLTTTGSGGIQVSDDKRTIAYVDSSTQKLHVVTVPAAAGDATELTFGVTLPTIPSSTTGPLFSLSRDGKKLAYAQVGTTTMDVYALTVAAAAAPSLIGNNGANGLGNPAGWWLSISGTGGWVAFHDASAPVNKNLFYASTSGSSATALTTLSVAAQRYVFADGKRIAIYLPAANAIGVIDDGAPPTTQAVSTAVTSGPVLNASGTRLVFTESQKTVGVASTGAAAVLAGSSLIFPSPAWFGPDAIVVLQGQSLYQFDGTTAAPAKILTQSVNGSQLGFTGFMFQDRIGGEPHDQLVFWRPGGPRTLVADNVQGLDAAISPDGKMMFSEGRTTLSEAEPYTLGAVNMVTGASNPSIVTNLAGGHYGFQTDNSLILHTNLTANGLLDLNTIAAGSMTVTPVMTRVVSVTRYGNGAFAGSAYDANGKPVLFSAKANMAAATMGVMPGPSLTLDLSLDGTKLFAYENVSGALFAGAFGGTAVTELDIGVGQVWANADGSKALAIAQHGTAATLLDWLTVP